MSTHRRKLLKGSASNLIRLFASLSVSLLLPSFLVHRMPPAEYSAWVLILQLSAYVTFLDFGMQTAIGKFVAEYDAVGDTESNRRLVSSAFVILTAAGVLGMCAVVVATRHLPLLFRQMPAALQPEVRFGLLLVGLSVALPLPLTIFGTIFIGLQQYGFPTVLSTASRLISAVVLVFVVLHHASLATMAVVMGTFNIATVSAGFAGWWWLVADRVPFSLTAFTRQSVMHLLEYCGTLGIWTLSTLLISGLDTAIVAHFDYRNTGYYAIAASATNFMLLLLGNFLGPLMPAASSLGTQRTSREMGSIVERATRYGVLLLLAISLPLLVGGYSILRLWVGSGYAEHAVEFLRILTLANIIRYLAYPYTLMVVAVGRQRYASLSPVVEAIINFTASILLAKRYGAIGVALGTLIGAGFGIGLHLLVSMPRTLDLLAFRRRTLVLQSVGRPALATLPSIALIGLWLQHRTWPLPPVWLSIWIISSVALAFTLGLLPAERVSLVNWLGRRISFLRARSGVSV